MKLRKLLSAILAAVMLLSMCVTGMAVYAEDSLPFTDVPQNWAYEAIGYVYENGLMNGTGGTNFSPKESLTRAMVVTVLYRLEGSPRVTYKDYFLDVEDRKFYSDATTWAKEAGIVNATDVNDWGEEYFSPTRAITRQELATMFLRFAQYKYVKTESTSTLDKFTDKGTVAKWAADAMTWATDAGIINGTGDGTTLSPKMTATRDQFATIIYRFLEESEFEYNLNYSQPKPLSKYTEPDYPLVDDADVYVAVDGNDNNPGTIDKPLATFDAARLKVRELKETAKDEIVVAFKAGNYGSLENVTFTAEDAGTADVPVKYCKYGDGDVIFCNGVIIDEKEFMPLDDSDKAMFKKEAQDKIYKVNLKGKIDQFGAKTRLFTSTGVAEEAREPNTTYYANVTTTYDERASIQLQHYLPGIVEKFSSYEGLKVNGFLRTGWLVDCFPVKSYDKENAILTFDFEKATFDNGYSLDSFVLMYEGRTDDLIYFSNLPEFVDLENEFWFDNNTSTLYVYNAKGDYAIDNGVEFITLEEGADYITLCGFEFNCTSGNGLIVKSNYFTFDQCKIGNIGGHAAINADVVDVHDFTVKNSEFYNFVDTGIFLASSADREAIKSGNNVIVNNYFHDFTLPMYFSSAIEVSHDVGTYIAHNEFYQGSHGGIRYNECIDIIIEYNVFDEMMTRTQDFGAVYTWNSVVHRDNHIRYNIFNNCHFIAIYLDDNTQGQHVYGNIFYNSANITTNGGRANFIHDNIIIKEGGFHINPGLYSYVDDEADNPADVVNSETYKRLTSSARPKEGSEYYELWYSRWPDMYDFSIDPADVGDVNCLFTTVMYLENNVMFNDGTIDVGEMVEKFGVDKNNVGYKLDENPFFVNPSIGDYSIREGADFADIHFEKIGRY